MQKKIHNENYIKMLNTDRLLVLSFTGLYYCASGIVFSNSPSAVGSLTQQVFPLGRFTRVDNYMKTVQHRALYIIIFLIVELLIHFSIQNMGRYFGKCI